MSDSVRPHRQQPTRLPDSWDSPGKNTGVGCHFFLQCMKVKSESEVTQSCPTPSDPMDCSLPGSSVHGILQASILEWVAIAFCRPKYCKEYKLSFIVQEDKKFYVKSTNQDQSKETNGVMSGRAPNWKLLCPQDMLPFPAHRCVS